jgi:hypothetical protein
MTHPPEHWRAEVIRTSWKSPAGNDPLGLLTRQGPPRPQSPTFGVGFAGVHDDTCPPENAHPMAGNRRAGLHR